MAFTRPTKHIDTPKPADKEGGVWAYKMVYGSENPYTPGRGTRVSTQQWYFIKSGGELKF